MRSNKTTVTAAAILTAGFALTAPAAHAATAPQTGGACASAMAAAQKAQAAFRAAAEDLKEQVARGGHPGTAEESNLHELLDEAEAAAADAARICRDSDRDHRRHHPEGAMETGVGSTSAGVDGGEVAAGVGLVGATGTAGLVLMRRRRKGTED
jgi:hypothetical protein